MVVMKSGYKCMYRRAAKDYIYIYYFYFFLFTSIHLPLQNYIILLDDLISVLYCPMSDPESHLIDMTL